MLRMFMGLCALCAVSVSAHSDEFTFRVKSLYKFSAQIKYYSQKRDAVWPGATTAWDLLDDEVHEHNLTCDGNELICFGAWDKATPSSLQWGAGTGGKPNCSDCCWSCANGQRTPVITLSSLGVLGKQNKHRPHTTLDASQDITVGVGGMDMPGSDFAVVSANSSLACQNSCGGNPTCKAWTWKSSSRQCFLKNGVPNPVSNTCCVSGQIDQLTKGQMSKEYDTDRFGADIRSFSAADSSTCLSACTSDNRCASWSFVRPAKKGERGVCFLKDQVAQAVFKSGVISGVKFRRANQ